MPFVRISLRKDLSIETKNLVSQAVHESLIQEFNIPVDDYFHVIEELEQYQIKYPLNYMGIQHSENIIFIQIIAGKGRTNDQKSKLYSAIATQIADKTEIKINDIIIILMENSVNDWSFGLGEVQTFSHI